jgi:hypothetical protein
VKEIGRALLILAGVASIGVGVLYLAVPPNETAEEGAADPIRRVRRPVVRLLRRLGFGVDRGLRSGSSTWGPEGTVDGGMQWKRETVYRGLFWPVGSRVTVRYFSTGPSPRRALRLCYVGHGERAVAAEATPANGLLSPDGRDGRVTGFIPAAATGVWTEEEDLAGAVHGLNGTGDIDRFWRE